MTREQYLDYMKKYNKTYKYFRKPMSSFPEPESIFDHTALNIEPTFMNFKGNDIDEPIVCSTFMCKTHLSVTEILCGMKCLSCQGKKKTDVTSALSF